MCHLLQVRRGDHLRLQRAVRRAAERDEAGDPGLRDSAAEGAAPRPRQDHRATHHIPAAVQDALRVHGQRHPIPQGQASDKLKQPPCLNRSSYCEATKGKIIIAWDNL